MPHTSHRQPHPPGIETPEEFEPDPLPVEPDEGLVLPAIPVDPSTTA